MPNCSLIRTIKHFRVLSNNCKIAKKSSLQRSRTTNKVKTL